MASSPLVLLTGVNGFVGAHVLDVLLEKNYRVRGAVRSISKSAFFNKKYPEAVTSRSLTFAIVPDIQAPHALDEAASDVDYICHVASPYFMNVNDPIKDLVEPAVNGTRNAIASAIKATKLKRMTILSSFASVVDLSKNPRPGYVYTEKDWDPITSEEAASSGFYAYHASKTWAEKAGWEMYEEAKSSGEISWDLVTFCPPMIYGPPEHEIDPRKGVEGLNTSLARLVSSVQGKDPAFAPKVATPGLPAWVDVRNVAEAHAKALALGKGVSQRFLLCGGVEYYEDGLASLRGKGEKDLGEVGAKCDPNDHFSLDVSQANEALGIQFIPFRKTMEDTWEKIKELGVI